MLHPRNTKPEEPSRLRKFLSEWGFLIGLVSFFILLFVLGAVFHVGSGDWANEPLTRLSGAR